MATCCSGVKPPIMLATVSAPPISSAWLLVMVCKRLFRASSTKATVSGTIRSMVAMRWATSAAKSVSKAAMTSCCWVVGKWERMTANVWGCSSRMNSKSFAPPSLLATEENGLRRGAFRSMGAMIRPASSESTAPSTNARACACPP